MKMTVGVLREYLNRLPDCVELIAIDHFGEAVEVPTYDWGPYRMPTEDGDRLYFRIPAVDIGEEPD